MTATFWLVLAAAIVLIGLAVAAMAVGAIFSGRCLRGSCGGASAAPACDDCPNRAR